MSKMFGSIYADAYDRLYHDKDYRAECDLIERIFKTYGDGHTRSILDLGCGTGNHVITLAQRGYTVVGVDRSAEMLAQAQRKTVNSVNGGQALFQSGDIRSLDLQRHFDAGSMMFASLGYQLENADVLSALRTARRHLRRGGLLIFDVWYGPAVLHQRPSQQVKVVPTPKGRILRVGSGELDTLRHLCTVHFRLWQFEGDRLIAETEESHSMRYFFPLELGLFLKCSGFTSVRLKAFPEFDKNPSETTWNVLGVAQAI